MTYAIVLAEDHADFRRLVRLELESAEDLQVVGEANDGEELINLVEQVNPDLIILDISMPVLGGMETARRVRDSHPQVKILFLSMHKNPEYVHQAQKLGMAGYLLKEEMDEALLSAIHQIRTGHVYISPVLAKILNNYSAT